MNKATVLTVKRYKGDPYWFIFGQDGNAVCNTRRVIRIMIRGYIRGVNQFEATRRRVGIDATNSKASPVRMRAGCWRCPAATST